MYGNTEPMLHYCLYSKMAKRKKTPMIKLAMTGLGGKTKEDLVREANQRRQEKIKAAKEREDVKQEKLRVEREKKMARDKEKEEVKQEKLRVEREKAEKQQKSDKEREKCMEKLRKGRDRANQTRQTYETEPPVKKFKMNKSYKSKLASSHRDETLNEWDPANMKAAVERYHAQQLPDWPVLTPKLSIR